jgi:hypothetical protein
MAQHGLARPLGVMHLDSFRDRLMFGEGTLAVV